MSPPHIPTCPLDGHLLEQWPDGIGCPHCLREWVVSVSEARPTTRINIDAPYAQLVLEIDRLSKVHHPQRNAA